ncbi:DUF3861 domain-containing protein [Xanthomonas citri]|uniref:DUF3861 domain-containing protein n=3 Tax=Xanthomonas citri TaxID=346 RepID=UPI000B4D1884|nr:DUF3861 domain-containing protein [Xanthomonas citri]
MRPPNKVPQMPHCFRITLTALDPQSGSPTGPSVSTDIANHDDLFDIIAKISERDAVPAAEAVEFAIGLKLFTEIVLRHRKEELFKDIQPHIGHFMKKLKSISPTNGPNA